jgi:pyruvate,water dikinase
VDTPDEDRNRFSLDDAQILELARSACAIENTTAGRWTSSGRWTAPTAGSTSCRPARDGALAAARGCGRALSPAEAGRVLATGRAIGNKIGAGTVRVVKDASKMSAVKKGDVLVTDMTDPNWEPVMKLAAAIVTNRGGRTCHAAIIARELGSPRSSGAATRRRSCRTASRSP